MERLTFEGNFCDIAQCESVPGGSYCESGSCTQREVWKRLKAYEDTGLTPEEVLPKDMADEIALKLMRLADLESICSYARLRELAEADREGRVVVLPCKVSDTVYWVHNKTITRCKVYRIQKNHKGIFICSRGDGKSYGAFQADLTIGKTVFLTREEAEEALRRAENG